MEKWREKFLIREQRLARLYELHAPEYVIHKAQIMVRIAAEAILGTDGPRYVHDCGSCLYMGRHERLDLWVCPGHDPCGISSFIGRASSVCDDYYSSLSPESFADPEGYMRRLKGTWLETCLRAVVKHGLYHSEYKERFK